MKELHRSIAGSGQETRGQLGAIPLGVLLLAAAVTLAALIIAALTLDSEEPEKQYRVEEDAAIQGEGPPICGQVLGNCAAQVTIKTDQCEEDSVRRALEEKMATPLQLGDCKAAEEKLNKDCGEGCAADYSSLIVVPGRLKLEWSPERDESGRCLARGSRMVTMRASCVELGGGPASETP